MMMGIMELTGAVALITGGGRRLGHGITESLARSGCRVIIHYGTSQEAAEEAAESLRTDGCEAIALGADLRFEDEIIALFKTVENRFGNLDILVNSAASFRKQAVLEIATEDWDQVMQVNLKAPMICLQQAVPLMHASPRAASCPAAVINIADLSGVYAWPGFSHHGVSKAGLLHLTRVAARELAPEIRVNAVIPGPILPPPGASSDDPDWRHLLERIPMARSGRPSEIGDAVVFLCKSDFMTGETLAIDGGEHLLGAGHRRL